MKIIFLNGPPRSGKDFAGAMIAQALDGAVDKFARTLKERTHALYGQTGTDGYALPHDVFEGQKDQALPEFLGISPRDAYIAVSERLMKPLHGQDIFGRLLLEDLRWSAEHTTIITDSGFAAEAMPLVEHFGADQCLLVRLYREGCTFAGDSRSYIELPGVKTVGVVNPGNPEELMQLLRAVGVIP